MNIISLELNTASVEVIHKLIQFSVTFAIFGIIKNAFRTTMKMNTKVIRSIAVRNAYFGKIICNLHFWILSSKEKLMKNLSINQCQNGLLTHLSSKSKNSLWLSKDISNIFLLPKHGTNQPYNYLIRQQLQTLSTNICKSKILL